MKAVSNTASANDVRWQSSLRKTTFGAVTSLGQRQHAGSEVGGDDVDCLAGQRPRVEAGAATELHHVAEVVFRRQPIAQQRSDTGADLLIDDPIVLRGDVRPVLALLLAHAHETYTDFAEMDPM